MKRILRENYKFIIFLIVLFLGLTIKFPYYIDAPGGISNMSKKIEIEGYESKGSFNLTYVKEYRATIPTMLVSLIRKDWKLLKRNEVQLDTEDYNSYALRDKILMEESNSNAIYVAYTKSNSYIDIVSSKHIVAYVSNNSNTDLKVGDEILSINNKTINNKNEILDIIKSFDYNDKLNIKVKNNNKEYNRYAYVINEEETKKIGILISTINEYNTKPKVKIISDENESGSSGGLITALYIYNSLIEDDITKGLTIVGTGTIDFEGNIGSIGGVEYKLKSAVKNKADLFIVPKDENYDEALKLKNKNNYKIDIIGVSTFDEAIEYLKTR